ncbi:hypothetical protein J6590_027369 [Homalodisca vitripennis]|nr:hypothetical protein J6590_027369 [Homalodisca vitripennis]
MRSRHHVFPRRETPDDPPETTPGTHEWTRRVAGSLTDIYCTLGLRFGAKTRDIYRRAGANRPALWPRRAALCNS